MHIVIQETTRKPYTKHEVTEIIKATVTLNANSRENVRKHATSVTAFIRTNVFEKVARIRTKSHRVKSRPM
jgi:hypothetical protein